MLSYVLFPRFKKYTNFARNLHGGISVVYCWASLTDPMVYKMFSLQKLQRINMISLILQKVFHPNMILCGKGKKVWRWLRHFLPCVHALFPTLNGLKFSEKNKHRKCGRKSLNAPKKILQNEKQVSHGKNKSCKIKKSTYFWKEIKHVLQNIWKKLHSSMSYNIEISIY